MSVSVYSLLEAFSVIVIRLGTLNIIYKQKSNHLRKCALMLFRLKMDVLVVLVAKLLPLPAHHLKSLLIISDYLESFFLFFGHHVQFRIVKLGLLILLLKRPKPEFAFHPLLLRRFKLFQFLWDDLRIWRRGPPLLLDDLFLVVVYQVHPGNKVRMKSVYVPHLDLNQISNHLFSLIQATMQKLLDDLKKSIRQDVKTLHLWDRDLIQRAP